MKNLENIFFCETFATWHLLVHQDWLKVFKLWSNLPKFGGDAGPRPRALTEV